MSTPAPSPPRSTGLLDAVVVGSGPNGLAAAVTLARAGLQVQVLEAQPTIGGGSRTLDLGLAPGIVHDLCSAVHPMAHASPFFRAFDLPARGVELAVPEASYAQPLDDEPAAIAWHDVERTAEGLGPDGAVWRGTLGTLAEHSDVVVELALGDKRSVPPALLRSLRGLPVAALFGAMVGSQGTPLWDVPLRTERARALLMGVAAHAIGPLPALAAGATGVLLGALAHAGGWPVPVGGSQALVDAMVDDLRAHGGEVITGHRVQTWRDVPPARSVLLDTTAGAAAQILANRLPSTLQRQLRRFRHGDAAAKVDFVLSGPVPWRDAEVGRACTQHLGGTREQMARAEAQVQLGRMPQQPVTLVSDPSVADPSRARDGLRPLWAYAHVPAGDPTDPTELVTAQIERFAPGFRDVVVASRGISAADMAQHNPSLVGGDIAMGRVTMWDMVARPTPSWDPYRLGETGWYLCSAATPPGPGVHGMSGWHAARRVLAREFGIRRAPELVPRDRG
ncbi:NAD(P)/FAD-dependent oxidoreductase [Brachybacterium sp. p3-SID957]|uniref:phytoene desaturase family protein n=1 Tax=Brachybacterium sp. p3-SID957 TaxID=2916049 RepID=UPI00223A9F6A|nr:NAD(P)/FAD-dependent oxidoreductase [Brachybacterium sp. p3-SID957]MCT1776151.1 NAD(P)/FAD-dependent oxidoreductase [Brachybacterium sp. p3-SID957]